MSLFEARDSKSTKRLFLAIQSLLLIVFVAPVSATTFKAGAARVDITPPHGLPMYGYFERIKNHQLASGTLDPLYARVLVLEAEKRLALVTLDLGRTFSEPWLHHLRSAARSNSEPTPERRVSAVTSIVMMCPFLPAWATMKPLMLLAVSLATRVNDPRFRM